MINKQDNGRCCKDCSEFKTWDQFPRKNGGPNGRRPYCAPCWKVRKTKYNANATPEQVRRWAEAQKKKSKEAYALKRRKGVIRREAEAKANALPNLIKEFVSMCRYEPKAFIPGLGEMERCPYCQRLFQGIVKHQIYCSDKCSDTVKGKRYRETDKGKEKARLRRIELMRTAEGKVAKSIRDHRRRAKIRGTAATGKSYATWLIALKKRKAFTCYWCGQVKPIKALTVDHINPIARGGVDSIENVCAACRVCNSRKHDKPLAEWAHKNGMLPL
jgi:5-methylcytosine-specific restriction endonuclease McrA